MKRKGLVFFIALLFIFMTSSLTFAQEKKGFLSRFFGGKAKEQKKIETPKKEAKKETKKEDKKEGTTKVLPSKAQAPAPIATSTRIPQIPRIPEVTRLPQPQKIAPVIRPPEIPVRPVIPTVPRPPTIIVPPTAPVTPTLITTETKAAPTQQKKEEVKKTKR